MKLLRIQGTPLDAEKTILVIDLTHGGRTLGRAIERYSTARVLLYDLYGKDKGSAIPDFDLCISPLHSPVMNPILLRDERVISHHRATGDILREFKKHLGCRIVEITGTKGKTSVATLLKMMLGREMRVLSLTSRGVEYTTCSNHSRFLRRDLSITPAHTLEAMAIAESEGLEVDIALFEVSLGFTGAADLNVLTSLRGDYPIAGGMLKASDAKKYTMTDLDGEVVELDDSGGALPGGMRFGRRQQDNLKLAIYTAEKLGVSVDTIEAVSASSSQIPSRMEIIENGDWVVVDDSNPAFDVENLTQGIEEILEVEGEHIVIVGGSYRGSCSKVDLDGVRRVIDRYSGKIRFYLSGEIGQDLIRAGAAYPFLEGGIDAMVDDVRERSNGNKGVILISRKQEEGYR
ncbi:MAG: Mur ligase middle domain-containing protein [Candidatus Syntrophoarchaeum caldarius]|uniref:Mur ligase middle domain-containing protein n=1 Tax=Candidatus Syntropharchaeum caldarium TaxID=1838285 RepID=A0A1F2PCP1_9EURY|nr:MAG: Mur ligase middle domain-containing protein [Candidatus Syntrophoarchaeum caldarius]